MRLRLSGGDALPEWLQDELYQLHPEPSDIEMLQLLIKDYIRRNGPTYEDLTPLGYITRYALESRCEDGSLIFFNHDIQKSTWHDKSSTIVQAFNEREAELKNEIQAKWGSDNKKKYLTLKFHAKCFHGQLKGKKKQLQESIKEAAVLESRINRNAVIMSTTEHLGARYVPWQAVKLLPRVHKRISRIQREINEIKRQLHITILEIESSKPRRVNK